MKAGVSKERLARELRVQAVTLGRWERREHRPQFRHRVLWGLRIRELRNFLQEPTEPAGITTQK